MQNKILKIVSLVLLIGGFSCHIPDLSGINLSACLRKCKTQVNTSCQSNQEKADDCTTDLQTCFDNASDCVDSCTNCEPNQTCDNEDTCNTDCNHLANSCTDQIKPCFDQKQEELKQGLTANCVDPLINCASDCVEEIDRRLN